MVECDRSEPDLFDKTVRILNFILSQKFLHKSAENYRNFYHAKMRIVSKLFKKLISNFDSANWRLKLRFCFRDIFREVSIKHCHGRVRLFIVLNDSAGSKMIMNIYFNFSKNFKGFRLFECRQGNLCMTANRNFVRFAHS